VRQTLVRLARGALPPAVKRTLHKLSVSHAVEGNMFFHIGHLRRLGYAPDVVVDVGAFEGEWTTNVLEIFPNAAFVMFEPQEAKQPLLDELCRTHRNVRLVPTILGNRTEDAVRFYEMESGSSIYEEQTSHPRQVRAYPMQTLDAAMKTLSLPGEVFLKLDVQGAERDVLDGATETLARCSFLLLEASVLNFNADAPLLDELVQYLKDKGFVLFDVCDLRRKANGTLFQLDLLFARADNEIRQRENDFS
jgi:FkbM family methyltransferase